MTGLIILLAIALMLLWMILGLMLAWEMRHPPRHTAGYAIARNMACDPGDLKLEYEEWTLERPGGLKLPVWEIANQSSGSPDRSLTAVFIHGWGHSRIDALLRVGLPGSPFRTLCGRLVFFDLRGHGDAAGTSRFGDDEAADLASLLEQLGDGRFVLVGHSMGAVIAMRAALPVAGIIAYGPYVDVHRSLRGRLRGAGFPTRPITDLAMWMHRVTGLRPRGVDLDMIKSLSAPILLVQGTEDGISTMEDAKAIVGAASNARLLEIPGADHLNAHEVDHARHDAAVGEFLRRVRDA